MTSSDSGQESQELLCTPRRSHKRLFTVAGSITKRSLFQQEHRGKENDCYSDDESDLGPMLPLALTPLNLSPSSSNSSPGRQFVSPLASPASSPQIPVVKATWDRLVPSSLLSDKRISPFSALRHLTRQARSSPKRRIFPDSPKSTGSPRKMINSPRSKLVNSPASSGEFVPDTPLRSEHHENHVEETPQKEFAEQKMITPLGSVNKDVTLPRLHRRKTLGTFDIDEISPEKSGIAVKRHLTDSSAKGSKLQKTDETCSIPKARASLFRDNQTTSMTVDTKSFYGTGRKDRLNAFGIDWKKYDESKKRRSLPVPRPQKRSKKVERNSGVSHGIKKPKPKKHVSRIESFKKNEQQFHSWQNRAEDKTPKVKPTKSSLKPEEAKKDDIVIDPTKRFFRVVRKKQTSKPPVTLIKKSNPKIDEPRDKHTIDNDFWNKNPETQKTEEIDSSKRFFRSVRMKRTLANVETSASKKPRIDILDANDLTVEETESESRKQDVDDLLRVLEDDWADDEDTSLETIARKQLHESPNFQDVVMSPASELSNMTSTMNIEDKDEAKTKSPMNVEDSDSGETIKYYPLFTKGFADRGDVSSPKKQKKSQLSKAGAASDQYQIDCGQKNFGATQCNECGVVYQMGDPEDENAHLIYHNSTRSLRFLGWKNERVIWDDEATMSRIILIEPNDNKQHWKKVAEILNVVDADLGLVDMQLSYYRDKKVYLYVRDKNVLGVLVVEPVKVAHRMIPEFMDLDCCSDESAPVKCGVNVVWTALSQRRRGIATQLVDTLRRNYFYGYIMAIDDIAFSTPTPSGKLFALTYTKTENFLVYG